MSSFCTHCGTQMPDGAAFCPHCGTARRAARVEATPQSAPAAAPQTPVMPVVPQSVTPAPAAPAIPQSAPAPQAPVTTQSTAPAARKIPLDRKKLLIPAIAVVAILAIVLLVLPGGKGSGKGSSYEAAIDNYLTLQIGKVSASKYKALAPQEYWDYLEDQGYDFDEYYERIADEVDERVDELEDQYGKNVKYTFEVTRERDVSERNLGYIAEYLADKYDIDVDDVTAGYRLDLEMTISGSDDSDTDEAEDVYVLKIGGKWYLAEVSLDKEDTRVYFYT